MQDDTPADAQLSSDGQPATKARPKTPLATESADLAMVIVTEPCEETPLAKESADVAIPNSAATEETVLEDRTQETPPTVVTLETADVSVSTTQDIAQVSVTTVRADDVQEPPLRDSEGTVGDMELTCELNSEDTLVPRMTASPTSEGTVPRKSRATIPLPQRIRRSTRGPHRASTSSSR